ncbi:MAG: TonB family protein [Prevotella sp.]|nr:TonB family protein [Prevotella sp.]
MVEFLIYDLKVAVLVAVFYMFYRLLLSHETFHRVNRVVLLATAVASFVLPLCVITLHRTVVVSGGSGLVSVDGFGMAEVVEAETPLWQTAVFAVFVAGVAFTLGHTLWGILKVWRLISHSEQHREADGITVCVTDRDVSPFSFCRYIVLSRSDYEVQDASILAHERGHISHHHSADVLLVDVLTALQWFNPAMWMLRQDLRAIHEYEADAAVLSQGINMRQYQYLLIQKAVAACGYSVANGITHSTLKNRINMMLTNKKTNRASWLKLLAMLPIVGTALALNAETVNDYVYEKTQEQPQKKVVKKGKKAAQVKLNDKTIEVKEAKAEETPQAESEPKLIIDGKVAAEPQQEIIKMSEVLGDREPLLVIDGKVTKPEQLNAINPKEIDNVSVIKNEDVLKEYAKHFNADTSNGILFINTKEYVKNGKKEIVSVNVKVKEPAEEIDTDNDAFNVVEQMPQFPGGEIELMKFLSENVKYPEAAEETGTQGRVVAQFIVEADGSITNVKVVKKVSEEIDAEAVRVIKAMPKWKPGMQKGQPVRVKYTIPVTFRLS